MRKLFLIVALFATTGFAAEIEIPASKVAFVRNPSDAGEGLAGLQFELPQEVRGKTILGAYIDCSVLLDTLGADDPGEVTIRLYPILSSWDAISTGWDGLRNNRGDAEPAEWLTEAGTHDIIRLSVTQLVQDWASLKTPNFGVLIAAEGAIQGFDAKRLATGRAERPVLHVWTTSARSHR